MLRDLVATLTVLVVLPRPAAAVTWDEARAAAAEHGPELLVAARRVGVARAEVAVAGALANPTLTVTTARETARLSTGLSVPMPLFGQRGAAMRAAGAEAEVSARESDVTRAEVRWNATVAWVDAWEAAERARLLAGAAGDAARLLVIARERFDAGSSPRLDVVRAVADEARARAEAGSAAGLVAAQAARLAAWIGADPLRPPVVTGPPSVPAGLPSLEQLVERVAAHPSLRRDEAQVRAAGERVGLEKRLRFPIVSAELVMSYGDPTLTDARGVQRTDLIAGAAFELPVLSLRQGAIDRAHAQRGVAEATGAADAVHLRADLVDAFRRTEAASTRARELARKALPAMEEAYAMTEESYKAGRADLVRVLEAQRAIVDLRLAQVEAVATWARAFADLERASSGPLLAEGVPDATR
jgi:cobalt-zinc-cadmium efflux system outer membrane protein